VRYLFTRATPPFTRALLIESGSRRLLDALIPNLYRFYGDQLEIDLVTCYAGVPDGFHGNVYHIANYPGRGGRKRLYAELITKGYPIVGMICSGESIMTKWKWAIAAQVPAKTFVLNENGDYFWVDWSHWRVMLHFALFRAGLTGAAAIPTIARLLFFPVSLAYLLLYAASVHLRRALRRA
jgi:hypothetical protein